MATVVSAVAVNTSANLYTEIKAIVALHAGWTLNTDTPPAANAFTLEYTSAVQIDAQPIKIRITSNTSSQIAMGVYDSSNTLRIVTTNATAAATLGCMVRVDDDTISIVPQSGSTFSSLMAGKIFTIYQSGFTGADNLGYFFGAAYRAKAYSDTGAIVASAQVYNPLLQATSVPAYVSENNLVYDGLSTEKVMAFPALVSQYTQYGIFGTLKDGVLLQTAGTTTTTGTNGAEFLINGVKYKRFKNFNGTSSAGTLIIKWE